jgi:phosphoglycolate phosphatase
MSVSNRGRAPKLILFDMDGTLVDIGHVHREAVFSAVKDVFGAELQQYLAPHVHQRQVEVSISILDRDLRHVILPGVVALLTRLQSAGHVLGLVTGTVSGVTNAVLERTGLGHFFVVRACGDEGTDRLELLQLAIDRAVHTSVWTPGSEVVVVGDAVRDIEAAKQLAARVVSVASGMTPMDELEHYTPDALLTSFEDVDLID